MTKLTLSLSFLLVLSTCIISVPIIKDGSNITVNQHLKGVLTNE